MSSRSNIDFKDKILNEIQKNVITNNYDTAKINIKKILDENNDDIFAITLVVSNLIKIVENVKINKRKLSGTNKKKIVITMGEMLLNDLLPEDKKYMLQTYNNIAEKTLEHMIDISKHINIKNVKSCISMCFRN